MKIIDFCGCHETDQIDYIRSNINIIYPLLYTDDGTIH